MTAARYPTAYGYALATAAESGYPTDRQLDEWLLSPQKHRKQLWASLTLLCAAGDARLKNTALQCARVSDDWCSLKGDAFRILAGMKGDKAVEQFLLSILSTYPNYREIGQKGAIFRRKSHIAFGNSFGI